MCNHGYPVIVLHITIFQTFNAKFVFCIFEDLAGEADNIADTTEHGELSSNVVVEPSVEEHVADGGAHGNKMETKERKMVESEMDENLLSIKSQENSSSIHQLRRVGRLGMTVQMFKV